MPNNIFLNHFHASCRGWKWFKLFQNVESLVITFNAIKIDPLRIDLDTFSQRLSVRMRFIVCWVSGKFPSNSNFQFRFASKKNYEKHFSTRFGIIFHLIFRLRGLSMESRARIHSEKQLSIHLALTTQQRVSRLSKALWCEKIERETARATCWIASRLYITISTAWVSFSLGERKHYRKNVFPHSKFALLSLTVVALTNTVAQNFSWMEWGGRGLDWLDGKIKSQNPVRLLQCRRRTFHSSRGWKLSGKLLKLLFTFDICRESLRLCMFRFAINLIITIRCFSLCISL